MSGPKCVGLSATERELLRQDNALKCDQLLARFRRREHELDQVRKQVEALGLQAVSADVPHVEELRLTVEESIRVWLDCDALEVLEHQLEKMEAALAENRSLLEKATYHQLMTPQVEEDSRASTTKEEANQAVFNALTHLPGKKQPKLQEFLKAWRQQQPSSERDIAWQNKLTQLWAQLIVTNPQSDWSNWQSKVEELSQEADAALRQSRYENLVLEASAHLKERRQWEQQQQQLQELWEQLTPCQGSAPAALREQVEEVLKREMPLLPQQLTDWQQQAHEELQQEAKRRQQASRRAAIFESLVELGYEPAADMETGWVENGRLILQKPEKTDYAVEIQTDTEVSKLQTSVIRFGQDSALSEQQRLRDLEAEEHWCCEHDQLLAKLRERGWTNTYQFKLAPGEHPVRLVPREGESPRRPPAQAPQESEKPPLS